MANSLAWQTFWNPEDGNLVSGWGGKLASRALIIDLASLNYTEPEYASLTLTRTSCIVAAHTSPHADGHVVCTAIVIIMALKLWNAVYT